MRVADPRVIVEQDPDGLVRELEAEAVLVAVVDPLGDEGGILLGVDAAEAEVETYEL